jgi:penicillin-binding protein 1A
MPDWQLTPEEEVFGDQPVDANGMAPMVDENGMPIGQVPMDQGYPQQQPMVRPDGTGEPSQQELDQAFPPQQQPPAPQPRPGIYPPQRQPPPPPPREPESAPPADVPQPRPDAA